MNSMLITCSFDEAEKYAVLGMIFSIANSQPEPPKYQTKIYLAPAWELVCGLKNKFLSEEEFAVRYLKQLNDLGEAAIQDLERMLQCIKDGGNVVWLCWEPSHKFCHRRITANWFAEKFGLLPEQLLLF